MNELNAYLNRIGNISLEEWGELQDLGSLKRFKKGEHVVLKGSVIEDEVFVEQGIVRAYILDDDGNEKSTAFFRTGEFMSTSALRTNNGRSLHFYEAISATTLVLFNSRTFISFLSGSGPLSAIGQAIKEKETGRLHKRDQCLMQAKAKNKYLSFIRHFPNLEKNISQKHIASYLGITPVTLSRIKADQKKAQSITIDKV